MPKTRSEIKNSIRALLVEDHLVLRTALRLLLSSQAHLQVVGEAANRPDALEAAQREKPDIVLLDLYLEDGDSFDLIPQLRAAVPHLAVLVLTGTPDAQLQRRAIAQGATGLVSKTQPAEVLLEAIDRVCAGEVWIDHALLASVFAESAPQKNTDPNAQKIATLTDREREIICLIGEGLRNKEIASRFFLSERTVHNHLASVFRKLGVGDRLELAIFAQKTNLIPPDK